MNINIYISKKYMIDRGVFRGGQGGIEIPERQTERGEKMRFEMCIYFKDKYNIGKQCIYKSFGSSLRLDLKKILKREHVYVSQLFEIKKSEIRQKYENKFYLFL